MYICVCVYVYIIHLLLPKTTAVPPKPSSDDSGDRHDFRVEPSLLFFDVL